MSFAMSSGQGSTTNLTQGSQEAFRALISSIAPETVPEGGGKLTPEAIQKLSEKLKEIVGEDAAKDFEHHRNEKGELVNEEGLPIIEISEPVAAHAEEEKSDSNDQATTIQDIPLIRLSSLPSVAREKLRQQRDRILDTLEEEERQEEELQERVQREEREEIARKRKDAAINEQGSLQKTQELQRKMGKALLRNMGSGNDDDSSAAQGESKDYADPPETKEDSRKKAVTFVESGDSVSTADDLGLGDVTAAKLRPGQGPTLLQSFRPDGNPVKFNVIERKPAGASPGNPTLPPPTTQTTKDSDDESEPDYPLASEDDESDATRADQHTDGEEAELEDEYDLDFAQHQREIALEYHEKRNTIGQEAVKVMMDPTHVQGEDVATSEEPIQSKRPKASVSRFKATRIASAYGTSSHNEPSISVAESVVPESMARTIQHAIRSGRIDDDDRLVGGEHDSDSENETQGLQETLELLRKSEVYNLGQEGHLFTAPRGTSSGGPLAGSRTDQQRTQEPQNELPPLNRPKVSKFKADLSHAGRPSSTSRSTTPISHAERSSPKLPSALADTVVEKKQPQSTNTAEAGPSHSSPLLSPPSSVAESSPSLRAPRPAHPQTNAVSQPFTSIIIDSPSFPNYSGPSAPPPSITPGSGAAFPPMIIDSPSFPVPGQQRSRRPERPPTVVSSRSLAPSSSSKSVAPEINISAGSVSDNARLPSTPAITPIVQERVAPQARAEQPDRSPLKKVSRFKQTRDTQS